MGCAATGHENCTCGSKRPPLLVQRIEKLERRVKRLEAKVRFQDSALRTTRAGAGVPSIHDSEIKRETK
jgi:hypothetical protein